MNEAMSGDGTERFMTKVEKLAWRRREIVTLLAYPNMGPLTAPAICINLGAGEAEVQTALQALLADGTVTTTGDVRIPAWQNGTLTQTAETLYTVPGATRRDDGRR